MKICKNCGFELSDNSNFCQGCGLKIENEFPAPSVTVPAEEFTPPVITGNPEASPSAFTPTQEPVSPVIPAQYIPQEMPVQIVSSPIQPAQPTPSIQPVQPVQPIQSTQPVQPVPGANFPPTPSAQSGYIPSAPPPQVNYNQIPPQGPNNNLSQVTKVKKPLNKKIFIFGGAGAVVVLAATIILLIKLLGGNSGSAKDDSSDPNIGVWNAVSAEMMGFEIQVSDVYTDGFSIELKEKGKCTVIIDGTKKTIKWSLEGNKININGSGLDMNGTLKDGQMIFKNVLDTDLTLIFEKEGSNRSNRRSQQNKPADEKLPSEITETGTESSAAATDLNIEQSAAENLLPSFQWWSGDWYGYWTMTSALGKYEHLQEERWDCFASIKMATDGRATVYLWDDTEELGSVEIQVEPFGGTGVMGGATSEGGPFFGKELEHADWIIRPGMEPYDDYMMIDGHHEDSEDIFDHDEFWYEIHLRPWGRLWDDIDADARPFDYDGWYIAFYQTPMLEAIAESNIAGKPVFIHPDLSGASTGDSSEPAPTQKNSSSADGAVYDYNNRGKMFVTYPDDLFEVDKNAILETLVAKDGSVKIALVAQISPQDREGNEKFLDSYADNKEYTSKEIEIAGYYARMITYYDSIFGYNTYVYVDFGEPLGDSSFYGIRFCISSNDSMEACLDDRVMAIVESLVTND